MKKLLDEIKNAGFKTDKGGFVLFGEYPQSLKTKDVTVSTETDARGYFLGSDGCYYAKLTAKPRIGKYKFTSGEVICSGKEYFFKVEPIIWKAIDARDGMALLLCKNVIDVKRFDEKTKVYANSELRTWLEGEFFGIAFDAGEKEKIATVVLEDGNEKTNKNEAPKEDKVFPLSFSEIAKRLPYGNEHYMRKASDYTRASGIQMLIPGGIVRDVGANYGNGDWWLRSPYRYDTRPLVERVDSWGNAGGSNWVDNTYTGVTPALWIKIN